MRGGEGRGTMKDFKNRFPSVKGKKVTWSKLRTSTNEEMSDVGTMRLRFDDGSVLELDIGGGAFGGLRWSYHKKPNEDPGYKPWTNEPTS